MNYDNISSTQVSQNLSSITNDQQHTCLKDLTQFILLHIIRKGRFLAFAAVCHSNKSTTVDFRSQDDSPTILAKCLLGKYCISDLY